ncbi:NAD(P)-dependent dehydrogenase (short-subunit alcohol dehydrogenase family) [Phyllobacterium ifriqiyense]|uniref:NAD(P)-dependent dehydrogenase (Short-subunit alcohol dehydrogenase family) n=1 Tax=Phyllobacterium ifriqiyense TaxID=314238 RepID=A0ABU0S5U9_9HYPH|nr:NAD(P)-dependent dehydrogenase (short-subunit alcohol dehydrogenase family) [Phyllobacterium ifriqiyense]
MRDVATEQRNARDEPREQIEQALLQMFAWVAVGYVGTLEEIADTISFLARPRALHNRC